MFLRVDKGELRRACAALIVTEPTVTISEKDAGDCYGNYQRGAQHINIFAGTTIPGGSLQHQIGHLNRTFLHELRHHWQNTYAADQFSDKPGAYWTKKSEEDARDWADENAKTYRIIRPAPRKVRSRLSRLSGAERVARS